MKSPWIRPALFAALLGAGCTHTAPTAPKENALTIENKIHAAQPQPEVWFKGSVDEAFARAQAENKLVFLYWGAVWCPPCNELKSNVFAKPEFAKVMSGFVPVYLDGDEDSAQIWGDRLQAAGYPTILVLNGQKEELYRLSTVVTIDEFVAVMQGLKGGTPAFAAAAEAAAAGKASDDELRLLAYSSWDQLPEAAWSRERRLDLLEKLSTQVKGPQEKALLLSSWVNIALGEPEKIKAAALKPKLDALLADEISVWAARETIKTQGSAALGVLKPKGAALQSLKKSWLAAAEILRRHPQASVDTRLWSYNPELDFYAFENPKQPYSPELKSRIEGAVRRADADARSEYDRHAVISGAAYLLREIGELDKARALLQAEIKKTNTPWYYQSSLSSLETEAKNPEEAKRWAAEARKSVEGRASRVQWITSDLLLNAKDPKAGPYLRELAEAFYEQSLALPDGFLGRNWSRAKRVSEALTPHKQDEGLQAIWAKFETQCAKQNTEGQKNCREHFAGLKG